MSKVKTAIIGLGNITHGYEDISKSIHYFVTKRFKYPTHLSAIRKNKNFILVGASDPSQESRQSFSAKVGQDVKIYSDHKEMIKALAPDLVVVASPTGTHVQICKDAIELGIKNIFCEKPIDYDFNQSQELIELVKDNDIKFAVNYFRDFDCHYKKLIEKIKQGKFGTIKSIEVRYSRGIYNFASHIINLLEKVFGPVKKVESSKKISEGWSRDNIDSNINFVIYFDDVLANFTAFPGAGAVVEIDLNFTNKKISIVKDKSKQVKLNIGTSMLDVYDNLYKYINDESETDCSGAEALQTLKVVDAAVKSLEAKKVISI